MQNTGTKVLYSPMSDSVCAWTAPQAALSAGAAPLNSELIQVVWYGAGSLFRIEKSIDGGNSWITAGTSLYQGFMDNAVTDQPACYRVISYIPDGDAAPSNTTCTAAPAAPSEVRQTVIDASTVELRWTDNSRVEDGYEIRDRYPDCFYDWDGTEYCYGYYEYVVAVLPANTNTYRMASGSMFAPVVYAMKDAGYSTGGSLAP